MASETVRRALDVHGNEVHTARRRPDPLRPAVLDDRGWLIERYETAWSIREIAAEVGVNEQLVGAALRRHGR